MNQKDTEYFAWCPLCNDAMTHKMGGKNEDNVYYCEGCEKSFVFKETQISTKKGCGIEFEDNNYGNVYCGEKLSDGDILLCPECRKHQQEVKK